MKDKRPNILILHTDQQRFDSIAALGGTHVVTPNMDRLVQNGVAFSHAYSSSPFCMPARHDLLTGTSARYHGYYQNQGKPIKDYGLATLPRLLTKSGYQTVAVGKMHHLPECEHHGFNHTYLMEEIPSTWENDAYVQFLQDNGFGDVRCQHGVRPVFYPIPQVSRVPEEYHGSAWVARKTNELLRQERDRPFFIFSSWVGPHPPFYVPQKYLDMYEGKELPPCRLSPVEEENRTVVPENDVNHRWVQRFKEGYFAAVSLIDTHVGSILHTLEETGLMENTLIIFTSDHGEMLGDRRHFSKCVPYEGSAHIPLILCGPGIQPDTRADVAANTWDIAATVLDAADIAVPEDHPMIGTSLLKLDKDDGERIVISHLFQGNRRWISAVSSRWKFIHRYSDGSEELYDLHTDAWEQHNLIREKEYGDVGSPTTRNSEMDGCRVADCEDSLPRSPAFSNADVGSPTARKKKGLELRRACVEFELTYGEADAISSGEFRDFPRPAAPSASMPNRRRVPWPFNWRQFPRWMNGYTTEDHEAILREMHDIIKTEKDVFISSDETWREMVLESWKAIGGRREDMLAVFEEADDRKI